MNTYRVTITYEHEVLAASEWHAEIDVLNQIENDQLRAVVKVVNLTNPAPVPLPAKEGRRGLLRRRRTDTHNTVSTKESCDRG